MCFQTLRFHYNRLQILLSVFFFSSIICLTSKLLFMWFRQPRSVENVIFQPVEGNVYVHVYYTVSTAHLEVNRGLSKTANTRWSSCYDYITRSKGNKPIIYQYNKSHIKINDHVPPDFIYSIYSKHLLCALQWPYIYVTLHAWDFRACYIVWHTCMHLTQHA